MNSGNLNFLGHSRPVTGLLYFCLYYFMLNSEPLSKSIKLQPLNIIDQFYTPLQTNFIIPVDIFYTNFNIFNNIYDFIYVLVVFADFLRMIKIELTCCSYDKFYVKNNNFNFFFLICGFYFVNYVTLLLQSLGLRGMVA